MFGHRKMLYACTAVFFCSMFCLSAASKPRTIRVARLQGETLYTSSIPDHDFLQIFMNTIGRYGNWNFEYINTDKLHAEQLLKEGKVDLIPFMEKNGKTDSGILYSANVSFTAHLVIAAKNDAGKNNIIRIGELASQKLNTNGGQTALPFKYIISDYDDKTALIQAEDGSRIDAVYTLDVNFPVQYKILTYIKPVLFYSAISASDPLFYKEWNDAFSQMLLLNPEAINDLTAYFFPFISSVSSALSTEEKSYIRSNNILRIAVVNNQHWPYFFKNKAGSSGIYVDVLNLIQKNSGLTFFYVEADDYYEALRMLDSGAADAVYAAERVPFITNKYIITNSYLNLTFSIVSASPVNLYRPGIIIGLPREYQDLRFSLQQMYPKADIRMFNTVASCLESVHKYTGSAALVSAFDAEENSNTLQHGRLYISPVPFSRNTYLLLNRQKAYPLCSIIDKSIIKIKPEDVAQITSSYMHEEKSTIIRFFETHPLFFYIMLAIFSAMFVSIIYLYVLQNLRKKKNKEIMRIMDIANRDSMTGLYNRSAFTKMVQSILEHQNGRQAAKAEECFSAFVMIDIDNFKHVNDTYGHAAGDFILMNLAELLSRYFRRGDITARMGGDEFAAFLPRVTDSKALRARMDGLVQEITSQLSKIPYNRKYIVVTCSIGVSFTGSSGTDTFDSLYQNADKALYKGKTNGKNCYNFAEIK